MAPNKSERLQHWVYYSEPNEVIIWDSNPIPYVDETIHYLDYAVAFQMVSAGSASISYWKGDVADEDSEKPDLKSHQGQLHFIQLPFSLNTHLGRSHARWTSFYLRILCRSPCSISMISSCIIDSPHEHMNQVKHLITVLSDDG